MATASIKPGQGASSEARDLPTTATNGTLAIPQDRHDYDAPSRDTIIPKLSLVNATGPLAKKFRSDYGKFVFEDRLVLGDEVLVIPLKLDKYFVECRRNGVDLKFEDEKKIFRTAKEAHAAGYAIDWDSQHTDKVEEAATVTFLVAGPEDDAAGAFFIPAAGKFFAPAVMTLRRGGYRDVYRQLYTAESRASLTGKQLWHSVWKLTSKKDCKSPSRDNEWAEPRITAFARLSAEDITSLTSSAANYGGKVVAPSTTE